MKAVTVRIRCLSFVLGMVLYQHSLAEAGRPFTVRDSILMRRVLTQDGYSFAFPGAAVALYAPDGKRFVVRARHGDIDRDENVDELLLFDTALVEAALESKNRKTSVSPKLILQHRFRVDSAEISRIRWLSDHQLGFLASDESGIVQALLLDVDSGRRSQLTHSSTDVVDFSMAADRIVYYAREAAAPEARTVRPLRQRMITRLLDSSAGYSPLTSLFSIIPPISEPKRITTPALSVNFRKNKIWMSPDGEYAIVLAPAVNAPAHWSGYSVADSERRGWTENYVTPDPTSYKLVDRHRYSVIDMNRGTIRSLFDAPDGNLASSRTPFEVFWLKGGHRAVVAHTYLPLNDKGVDEIERHRRAKAPAIAEVDVRTGEARAIVFEPFTDAKAPKRGEEIVALSWNSLREELTLERRLRDGTATTEIWARTGETWRVILNGRRSLPDIQLMEGPAERPKLYATGGTCRCTRVIFDPAPDTDLFSFGRQEILKWTDSRRNEWQGGLIYPVGYVKGRRYPFILQTHGYMGTEFVIDGPQGVTTAFAAQAFANAGFVVLQAADHRAALTLDSREGHYVADGWLSAINKLDDMGLIDPTSIGVIGFSRTGFHVLAMLAEHPNVIAAATIADSVQYGYSAYLLETNSDFELARSEFDSVTGGDPARIGYGTWFESQPLYRMTQSDAALRIEAIGEGSLLYLWETYAIRARGGKPADLVYFPEGSHALHKPSERLGSQGGNVDWFRFWLQSYEDPDPKKQDQYKRWRELRNLRR